MEKEEEGEEEDPGESGLVSRGSQGLRSPLESRRGGEMATHSSILAWRIPGTGERGGLLSMG